VKRIRSPRKKPRQDRSHTTVASILEAAARIFVEKGFEATTTNAIAKHAGVSIGSLYQYFPNKLALLEGVRERHVKQLWRVLGSACDEACAMPWPDALRHVLSAGVAHNLSCLELCSLFATELPVSFSDDPHMSGARSRQREKLRRLFHTHRASIRVTEEEAVFAMPAIARGLFTATLLERPQKLHSGVIADEIAMAVQRFVSATSAPHCMA